MSTNSGTEQDVRHHYTLVCQCEWSEDEFTRTTESRNCVIHGDEPDPLYALLAEVEQLRAALSEVEWNGYAYIGLEPCPCCGNERSKGHHTDDCLVGRAVRG